MTLGGVYDGKWPTKWILRFKKTCFYYNSLFCMSSFKIVLDLFSHFWFVVSFNAESPYLLPVLEMKQTQAWLYYPAKQRHLKSEYSILRYWSSIPWCSKRILVELNKAKFKFSNPFLNWIFREKKLLNNFLNWKFLKKNDIE